MRRRRTVLWLAGALVFAAASLAAVGSIWPESWVGQLLSGAGVHLEQEPDVFPAEHVVPAGVALDMQSLDSEQPGTTVTFHGLLSGWCTVYGTDPAHPDGTEYYAGTLRIEIESQEYASYCIDLARTLETGDSYQARIRVPAGDELCPVYWILDTYHYEQPGAGLNSREEGAAIQVAIWHYLDGFQPGWDSGCWCYKQAVYDRAVEIIEAARGQCTALPDTLSLAATATTAPLGAAIDLVATLTDSAGQPLADRQVVFSTEIGELVQAAGPSDAQGQVRGQVRSDTAGLGRVTALARGNFAFGAVVPLDFSRQPLLIQNPTSYYLTDGQTLTWVEASLDVEVESFAAALIGHATQVQWRTTREVAVSGFNLYHRTDTSSSWTRLNETPIASRGQDGGEYEWVHAEINPAAEHFYLLEAASPAAGKQFGPVLAAHRIFLPLCAR
ncbi:MAG: Ig-like domain-containing protein [Anaerolineae bacterium]|nr:Ig-like domain-containing protein [Anaerolineae bacterium]